MGVVDIVLLSHDHHYDNLDHSGRDMLPSAGRVLTTLAGAGRLHLEEAGFAPWDKIDLPGGTGVRVTATPARHGPAGSDRGPVIGFVLQDLEQKSRAIYISGDTVWYDELEPIAERFDVGVAVLFMGAAKVSSAGDDRLTMSAHDGVAAAHNFTKAMIVPLHFEDWAHFSERQSDITEAFAAAEISDRLVWLPKGRATTIKF